MTPLPPKEELGQEAHELIRFLLRDHAFSEEFLVTAIQEYFQGNSEGAMEPHQQRVVEELKQLTDRREKLGIFMGGGKVFGALPADEQSRLRRQFDIMVSYEGVLQERINHFPKA